jgi:hypothetical protein
MHRTPILLSAALGLILPLASALADAPAAAQPAGNCGALEQKKHALHQAERQRRADVQDMKQDQKNGDKSGVRTEKEDVQNETRHIRASKQAMHKERKSHPCQDVPKAATGTNPPP